MAEETPEFNQVRRFWQNPRVEQALLLHDVESTVAHVRMLGETGIIDKESATRLIGGLEQIGRELSEGKTLIGPEDIDIHMSLERRLEEIVGPLSAAVRVAKSRNDQIATDIRLWLRDAVFEVFADLCELRRVLLSLAERDLEVMMPGYTHMQPAMPILLAHWWLAHEARFRRDCCRLLDLFGRLNCLPLGAGVLAGTSQPIDRELVAGYLGFDQVIDNSLDAVSDRDYLVEFASFASLTGLHLSQLSSEILLWATQEFGFVRVRRPFVFRSRTMPQKRNPELLEMLRSRPSAIHGRLMTFLSQLKGLPMGYCQDLQESLPGLFDSVDVLKLLLELTVLTLPALEFDAGKMKEMASADLTNAANAVDFLVTRGIPQEKAAKIVDSMVSYCKQRHKYLADLALSEWQQFSPAFDAEIYEHVTIEESVGAQMSYGGTAQVQVSQALERARQTLEADRQRLRRGAGAAGSVRAFESIGQAEEKL
jgi:argininosuccinate lyase